MRILLLMLLCSGLNAMGSIEGSWCAHDTIWVFTSDGSYTCYLNGDIVSDEGFYVEGNDTIHLTYKLDSYWQDVKVRFFKDNDTLFIQGYVFVRQNLYCKKE